MVLVTIILLMLLGGQHDGHLPFWLPAFVKLISLFILHVLLADGEINIPLLVRIQRNLIIIKTLSHRS